jgi:transposase
MTPVLNSEATDVERIDGNAVDRGVPRGVRLRVITRPERRRSWSDEQKRDVVAESLTGEMTVSEVARKHDISPGQLFTWRRQLVTRGMASAPPPPSFARVEILGLDRASPSEGHGEHAEGIGNAARTVSREGMRGAIEILLGAATVRVDAFVDQDALRRVLRALGHR